MNTSLPEVTAVTAVAEQLNCALDKQDNSAIDSSLAAVSSSTPKPKTRATPRRIPGLSKTDGRGFLKSDRDLLGGKKKPGSLYAALMMGQLRRDFKRNKDGNPGHATRVHEDHYWVAYSLTYWERQLGLTENEARSGVQCLANSNGVAEVGKFKFGNEPKYQHFRLTEKALGYVPATPVEGGCVATTQGVCANHTAMTPTVFSPTVFKNIQDGVAGNTTPESTPEIPKAESGKTINPKTEQASEPFLQILLKQKREFIKLDDNGENTPCVLSELTPEDRSAAQRLEYELTKAGIDALAFANWLTPIRFQRIALLDLNNGADWSLFVVMSHRETFFDKYRAYVADRAKFVSAQQLALTAMAPAGLKPALPLYERDPVLAVGMFSWDQHWLDNQEGGMWGNKTRLEHLRKFARFTPEMEGWLDNEALLAHVLELQGGIKHKKTA